MLDDTGRWVDGGRAGDEDEGTLLDCPRVSEDRFIRVCGAVIRGLGSAVVGGGRHGIDAAGQGYVRAWVGLLVQGLIVPSAFALYANWYPCMSHFEDRIEPIESDYCFKDSVHISHKNEHKNVKKTVCSWELSYNQGTGIRIKI